MNGWLKKAPSGHLYQPRDLRHGEVLCSGWAFVSDYDAWRQIATASDTYSLGLEYDSHLSDVTPVVLVDISGIPADADIVRLESTGQWLSLGKPVTTAACRPIRALRSAAWGAGAYLMSRNAATSLLCSDPALKTPADDFLFNRSGSSIAQSLTTYQTVPAIAVNDKLNAEEAIVEGFGRNIETDTINARLRGIPAFRRRVISALRGKTQVEFA